MPSEFNSPEIQIEPNQGVDKQTVELHDELNEETDITNIHPMETETKINNQQQVVISNEISEY